MRSLTVGALAVALAAVAGAGVAQADQPAPAPSQPNEIIFVDINLLGCSIGAGLGGDLLTAMTAGQGSSASISTGLASRLRAAHCLPWK